MLPLWRFVTSLLLLPVSALMAEPLTWERTRIHLGGQSFQTELAISREQRAIGLMHRPDMNADEAMLFVYPEAAPLVFWNKNVRFPIDILFFDRSRRLINTHHQVPPCPEEPCHRYRSDSEAKYVVELKGGVAHELSLTAGAAVFRFEDEEVVGLAESLR